MKVINGTDMIKKQKINEDNDFHIYVDNLMKYFQNLIL